MKGTGQTFALMYLTFASSEMNSEQVSEFLTRVIQPRFATLEGVGGAEILGGREFSMRVWLDPQRLAARGVTASDVRGGDPRQQLPRRAGQDQERVTSPTRSRCRRRSRRLKRFATLPIRANGDQVVRLRDVADVELGPKSTDTKVSFNGKEGTFIGITPTPAGNPADRRLRGDEGDRRNQARPCPRA